MGSRRLGVARCLGGPVRRVLFAACLLMALPGCQGVTKWALGYTGNILADGFQAIMEDPDVDLVRDSLPGNLKTVEVLLASSPYDPNLLYALAQGYGSYAWLVLEDEMDLAEAAGQGQRAEALRQRAQGLYRRTQVYAARMLTRAGRSEQDVLQGLEGPSEKATARLLGELDRPDARALFWYTFGWVSRINLDPANPERVSELPRVEQLMARVVELDPTYFYGLPLLLSGALYAGRAPMYGGDLERGRAFFEKAIAASQGRFLVTRFAYGRYYGVQAQDRELFCRMMNEVLEAPEDLLPEQQMMNNVTRRWAKRWRERASSLFEESQDCPPVGGQGKEAESQEVDDGEL
ncbi:MAG TPA: TRAP transporter TatT component family protein [Myxococcota bacterium]|nr:TRAP transporter TatT component family protein [Myxococcota bacterium]HQK52267.1 TRAP transporter TatT component family protein [Myxococcota bacterium]